MERGFAKVVRLLKNELYPTYQLHAEMANGKTPLQDGLRYGALTVTEWLCSRLGEDTPDILKEIPGPDAYQDPELQLPSLHVSSGYIVDIVSIPEDGMWTLQITEPDLGSDPGNPNQLRQAVPGRVFETNIGFRIKGAVLECGIATIVSDPEGTTERAEVYRPAVVNKLIKAPCFGLRHVDILIKHPHLLDSKEKLKELYSLWRNPGNQLPCVVFTWYRKEESKQKLPTIDDFINRPGSVPALFPKAAADNRLFDRLDPGEKITGADIRLPTRAVRNKTKAADAKNETGKQEKNPKGLVPAATVLPSYPESEINTFASNVAGFAHVYILADELFERFSEDFHLKLKPGQLVTLLPVSDPGESIITPHVSSLAKQKEQLADIKKRIMCYPLGREIDFGNIAFLSAARESLARRGDTVLAEADNTNERCYQEVQRLKNQFRDDMDRQTSELDTLKKKLEGKDNSIRTLEDQKRDLSSQHNQEMEAIRSQLSEKDTLIECLRRRLNHPGTHAEIATWAEKQFGERLIIHEKAKTLLKDKSAQKVDLDQICDALDYLATDYWENRYAGLTKEDMLRRCSDKYSRPFDITPVSDATVEYYPKEYKIKYFVGAKGKPVESPLDTHLRIGNDAEFLLRIYFLHDDDKQRIVIGSLPNHLSNIKIR